jgi:hypothetical protein
MGDWHFDSGPLVDGPSPKERRPAITEEQVKKIDAFLTGWGGAIKSREVARYYLEETGWDVQKAQDLYWRENILVH